MQGLDRATGLKPTMHCDQSQIVSLIDAQSFGQNGVLTVGCAIAVQWPATMSNAQKTSSEDEARPSATPKRSRW